MSDFLPSSSVLCSLTNIQLFCMDSALFSAMQKGEPIAWILYAMAGEIKSIVLNVHV